MTKNMTNAEGLAAIGRALKGIHRRLEVIDARQEEANAIAAAEKIATTNRLDRVLEILDPPKSDDDDGKNRDDDGPGPAVVEIDDGGDGDEGPESAGERRRRKKKLDPYSR